MESGAESGNEGPAGGDVIVAVGTPAGSGARHLIRMSGPDLLAVMETNGIVRGAAADLVRGRRRGIAAGRLHLPPDREPGLAVLVSTAPGPRSFTGEDVIEIQCPGNDGLASSMRDGLVAAIVAADVPARSAGPGEFSARAYLAGRLTAGDAVAIALSIQSARDRELRGIESWRRAAREVPLKGICRELTALLARLEAGIDFSDEEDVVGCSASELARNGAAILEQVERLEIAWSAVGGETSRVPKVTFIGPPNAGKSTLVNRLAGLDRAVVSPIPGTTRDAVETAVRWPVPDREPLEFRLVDTAGLGTTEDPLALDAETATFAAIAEAAVVVRCHPIDQPSISLAPETEPDHGVVLDVRTRIDLAGGSSRHPATTHGLDPERGPMLAVSAITGVGMGMLQARIATELLSRDSAGGGETGDLTNLVRERLQDARGRLEGVLGRIPDATSPSSVPDPEIAAAELRGVIEALSVLEGGFDPDQVLDEVFGRFCIGK